MYTEQAISLLHECATDAGFTASPQVHDNYCRVWSRDSMLAGLAAFLIGDKKGIDTLKRSVLSLGKHQSSTGQIPSNISIDGSIVSYGSLAGRVDATTWWIIGACWSLQCNSSLKPELEPKIRKAFQLLDCWEMNDKGLIYTPLGGNWADEYISQGYVLYDQLLRLWAFRAYFQISKEESFRDKAESLQNLLELNYSFTKEKTEQHYHPVAYEKAFEKLPYWAMSFSPAGYDKRWDMAANALALLLQVNQEPQETERYLLEIIKENGNAMLPVFFPVIEHEDVEWNLLKNNFLYTFKNEPNHFHNGGSWPVFLGLLSLGFRVNERNTIPQLILNQMHDLFENHDENVRFSEYWNNKTMEPGGVAKLGFSAAGYLMLSAVFDQTSDLKKLLLC
jgi:hypothetical protein